MSAVGGVLVMKPFQQGDPNQQWERAGNLIKNRQLANKVLDIHGETTLTYWLHQSVINHLLQTKCTTDRETIKNIKQNKSTSNNQQT